MLRLIRRIPDKNLLWKKQLKVENYCRPFIPAEVKLLYVPTVRFYAKQELCPPPKRKGGSGFMYTLGAIALVTGGTIGYAKYDPEFRKVLVEYFPFADDVIKFVFQEDNSIHEMFDKIRKAFDNLVYLIGLNPKKIEESKSKLKSYVAPPLVSPEKDKDECFTEIRLEQKEQGKEEPSVTIAGEPKHKPPPPGCEEEAIDLEVKLCESATEAINAYNKAARVVQQYNSDIEAIIDGSVNEIKPSEWEKVRHKTRSKNECLARAKVKAAEAVKNLQKLIDHISKPTFAASDEIKCALRSNIIKVQEDLEDAKRNMQKEIDSGGVTEKYWEKVEKARNNFTEELAILFPSIDLSNKKLHIDSNELDLFLVHVFSHVLYLQKELARAETVVSEKVKALVELAKKGDVQALTDAQICEALEPEKRKLSVCFQQECLKLRKEAEANLREQMRIQSQAFTDHLEDALKTREIEIERCLARKFDEQLDIERSKFKKHLAAMVGRLRGVDQAMKAKHDADEAAKRSQVLWSACQALLRAIRAGCAGLPWQEQIRSLTPEITAVKNAAGTKDELVNIVLNSIPAEAQERGIYPEDALRERFFKVEEIARNVALVPECGAALPIHILSYLQSILLVKAASTIPQAELNDEKVDFSKLNTNEILQRARYWLDRGDFAQALKYMNLLKGAPRCVARQWMNETRIYLETQQAANTLMAHAASSGLIYL